MHKQVEELGVFFFHAVGRWGLQRRFGISLQQSTWAWCDVFYKMQPGNITDPYPPEATDVLLVWAEGKRINNSGTTDRKSCQFNLSTWRLRQSIRSFWFFRISVRSENEWKQQCLAPFFSFFLPCQAVTYFWISTGQKIKKIKKCSKMHVF